MTFPSSVLILSVEVDSAITPTADLQETHAYLQKELGDPHLPLSV